MNDRIDIGKVEDKIRTAPEADWKVNLGSLNLSNAVDEIFFKDAISQPGEFELSLEVNPGGLQSGDELFISKDGVDAFSGVAKIPEDSSQRNDSVSGMDATEYLRDVPINGDFLGTNTDDVVNSVFSNITSSRIQVGVNERLNGTAGTVDVRADEESALSLLNRVVLSHGGDWYVSYNESSDVFEFNVESRYESASTVKSFNQTNTRELKDSRVVDEEYDGVVVKGYADGEDQVRGEYPARTNWPDDPKVLVYTDKTIVSENEANNTAENLYNEHTEWRNIYVIPANENEVLQLGDLIQVDDENTGVSGEFRVVQRKVRIFRRETNNIEYVLSDRPIGILDSQEGVKEQTDSQTDYMQGSRNVWGEKESDNCSDQEPLELDIYVPEDVVNKAGENKTASIELNYSAKPYRQSGSQVDEGTVSVDSLTNDNRVKVVTDNTDDRMTDTDSTLSSAVSNLDNSDVLVESSDINDHNHPVASSTSDAENVTSTVDIPNGFGSEFFDTGADNEDVVATVGPINQDALFHIVGFRFDDSGNGTADVNLRVSIEDANNGAIIWTEKNESVASSSHTDTSGGLFQEFYWSDSVILAIGEYSLNDDYSLVVTTSGLGSANVSGRFYAAAVTHDHEIPRQTGGASSGAEDEQVAFEKTDQSQFQSDQINESSGFYIDNVDDNTSSTTESTSTGDQTTVEDVATNNQVLVSNIDEDVLVDQNIVATELTSIEIDGTDITNDLYGSTSTATAQDEELDITEYLEEPGWHTVTLTPDQTTFLKSRVFLDHHKDA